MAGITELQKYRMRRKDDKMKEKEERKRKELIEVRMVSAELLTVWMGGLKRATAYTTKRIITMTSKK